VDSARYRLARARDERDEAEFRAELPAHDQGLADARKAEDEAVARYAEAEGELGALQNKVSDAEHAVAAARLKLAEGAGSKDGVAQARAALDSARDHLDGHRQLVGALAGRVAELRGLVTLQTESACLRSFESLMAEARSLVAERDRLHRELEPLARKSRVLARVLSQVVAQARQLGLNGCRPAAGLDVVLDGRATWVNGAGWPTTLFADEDGPLKHWRRLARECGLMPTTAEDDERRAKERERLADALVDDAVRTERTKAHLGRVFRAEGKS
jgi:hypothetical protein